MDRNFQRALSLVLKSEGGWSDNPADPGGATMKGVTLANFRRYVMANATKADLRKISDEQIATVYRRFYWDAVAGAELPDGVDYAVFDFAVNSGPGRAAKNLQAACGVGVVQGGLANILQTNGQGIVGGIDAATWTFWRNKFREATGTNLAATPNAANAATFKADMNAIWLTLNRGADKPDLITFSHDFYSLYETGEQQLQRYMDADMAQSGFIGLKYKTADVIFDDNTNFTTTAEKGYFLNSDYLYVDQHKEAQWTQDDEKKPVNQDAVVIPFYWMGNVVCTNRSLQGVLFDAA